MSDVPRFTAEQMGRYTPEDKAYNGIATCRRCGEGWCPDYRWRHSPPAYCAGCEATIIEQATKGNGRPESWLCVVCAEPLARPCGCGCECSKGGWLPMRDNALTCGSRCRFDPSPHPPPCRVARVQGHRRQRHALADLSIYRATAPAFPPPSGSSGFHHFPSNGSRVPSPSGSCPDLP